ncbi:hypothetical protein ET33_31135 [Paenibacillus tyrfis]|uniref:Uncharacterized protein n=1 Tax=Paenibacillus tyrfis TaxID=1501230 RepID=A0A081P6K4_9BACL|nr:hypothetical protein ET33_31135 [Paenibacillus tyrfis]
MEGGTEDGQTHCAQAGGQNQAAPGPEEETQPSAAPQPTASQTPHAEDQTAEAGRKAETAQLPADL